MSDTTQICVEWDEDLSALLDGELAPPRADDVRAHVETCERCARRLEALAHVTGFVVAERASAQPSSRLPTSREPAPLRLPGTAPGAVAAPRREVTSMRVPSRARSVPRRRVRAMALALAAAAALVLVLRLRPRTPLDAAPSAPAQSVALPALERPPSTDPTGPAPDAPVANAAPKPTPVDAVPAASRDAALEATSPLDSASDDELVIVETLDTIEDLELIENLELIEQLAARERS